MAAPRRSRETRPRPLEAREPADRQSRTILRAPARPPARQRRVSRSGAGECSSCPSRSFPRIRRDPPRHALPGGTSDGGRRSSPRGLPGHARTVVRVGGRSAGSWRWCARALMSKVSRFAWDEGNVQVHPTGRRHGTFKRGFHVERLSTA
eukprot:3278152-Prymnesium_polylepis.2